MLNNVLIIKPSSLGDVVHSLPVLAKLRETLPDARISWLIGTAAAPVLESNPSVNRLFYFRRKTGGLRNAFRAHGGLIRELAYANFDCVIDLQGLLRSALFSYVTRAPMRVGLSDAREGARHFYTHVADVGGAVHAVDRYLRVGTVLGFDGEEPDFALDVSDGARRSIERVIRNGAGERPRPYFALATGARWPSKSWPDANLADAAARLQTRFGGTFFILGSAAGGAGAAVSRSVGAARVIDLSGRTSLEEVIALIGRCDMLITPDTGLMHVADAIGTPLVAVFGPTSPEKTGPYFQRARVVTARGACGEAPCFRKECPDVKCMREISGAEVASLAEAVLEGAA